MDVKEGFYWIIGLDIFRGETGYNEVDWNLLNKSNFLLFYIICVALFDTPISKKVVVLEASSLRD